METALMNNWKSMEAFQGNLRKAIIKILNQGKQTVKYKSNRDIGDWEIQRINWFMKIFPQVNITTKGRVILVEMETR